MSKAAKSKEIMKKDHSPTSLETVRKFYPNALTMEETIDRAYKILKDNFNLKPRQIMRADCTCADDVNAIQEPENFRKMLGPFKMGGLNGFPFTGAVGMGAYSHHVPDDGALFIHYAPHVGISKKGVFGEILRIGQTTASSSCGAAVGAVNNLINNMIIPEEFTRLDFQFNTIEQIFLSAEERIREADIPLKAATDVMYEAIERRIYLHFNRNKPAVNHCKYVILMGGILVNGDGKKSFNDCRRFSVYNVAEEKWQDFLTDFRPIA